MKEQFTAKTVAEAKERAVEAFGVPEERISFTVLEEPKKGLFGMKGEAKVEAEYEKTKAEVAADYVSNVMVAMGFNKPEITVSDIEGGSCLDLAGEGVDGIIGRRGETIDALQYLASLACNKHDKDYYRISLDCDGFRARRKVQLEELARKMAAKAKRTDRTVALEPMNHMKEESSTRQLPKLRAAPRARSVRILTERCLFPPPKRDHIRQDQIPTEETADRATDAAGATESAATLRQEVLIYPHLLKRITKSPSLRTSLARVFIPRLNFKKKRRFPLMETALFKEILCQQLQLFLPL